MDHVRLAVLRSGAGDLPNLLLKVELVPRHLSDFLPALGSQGENLNNAAVGSLDLPSCLNDASEFVIAEHTVPRNSRVGSLTPSQGERSMIALPTHQLKKVFAICRVLLAAIGARSTISLTSSMTSRRVTS